MVWKHRTQSVTDRLRSEGPLHGVPSERILTSTQLRCLLFIIAHINTHQRPPTVREIMVEFGWGSANGAKLCVDSLVKKGVLKKDKASPRALRPTVSFRVSILR